MPSCGCVRRADPGSRQFKIPDEVPLRSHAAKVALSLDEIAADLTVSVNTVKCHVRSVYIGLAVTSRRTTHETRAPHGAPVSARWTAPRGDLLMTAQEAHYRCLTRIG